MKPLMDFQKTELLEKVLFDLQGLRDMSLEDFLRHFGLIYLDSMLKQLDGAKP
jgi:hypothetical protein